MGRHRPREAKDRKQVVPACISRSEENDGNNKNNNVFPAFLDITSCSLSDISNEGQIAVS